jgi:hypothetical protein
VVYRSGKGRDQENGSLVKVMLSLCSLSHRCLTSRGNPFFFFLAWAFALVKRILTIPVSVIESGIWMIRTYYTIGYAPAASRNVLLRPVSNVGMLRTFESCALRPQDRPPIFSSILQAQAAGAKQKSEVIASNLGRSEGRVALSKRILFLSVRERNRTNEDPTKLV